MRFNPSIHDFDRFVQQWGPEKEYILFGASPTCRDFLNFMEQFLGFRLKIKCILDIDSKYQGRCINPDDFGLETPPEGNGSMSFEVKPPEFLKEASGAQVIITSDVYRRDIVEILDGMGFSWWKDFCSYRDIVGIWSLKHQRKTVLWRSDLMITSRCTLRCKNCNMYIPYYKHPADIPLSNLINDVSLYFKAIDVVNIFHLVGGEPFLYSHLADLVTYIGENHRDQICQFLLTSNGMVIPSDEVLAALSKYDVVVNISDYTSEISYKTRLEQVKELMTEKHVKHEVRPSLKWTDFGRPSQSLGLSTIRLMGHFDRCTATYRGLHEAKLYYCNLNCSAVAAGLFLDVDINYIDLGKNVVPEDIVKFDLGFAPLGFITFCQYCNGCNTGVGNTIVAAAQLK